MSVCRLANALTKIDQFNEEEASFGWELSQYPKRKNVYDRLVPFKKLFDAGYDFLEKYNTWMTTKVSILSSHSFLKNKCHGDERFEMAVKV